MAIKAIIIDYGEVVATGYDGVEYLIAAEFPIEPEEFMEQRRIANEALLNLMRGRMTEREYIIDHLLKGTGWTITPERLMELIRQNLNQPNQEVIRVLDGLRGKYPLMLFSDNLHEWVEYIRNTSELLDYFDACYFSNDIGMVKSDDGAFEYVVSDLELLPSEILFIDDRRENLESALRCGLNVAWYLGIDSLVNSLKGFDIDIDS
ncbi:MAG: HAD-IA family hydrolase [Candidatus Saccharimonadales bacterium]